MKENMWVPRAKALGIERVGFEVCVYKKLKLRPCGEICAIEDETRLQLGFNGRDFVTLVTFKC